jgi:hypothetical protein
MPEINDQDTNAAVRLFNEFNEAPLKESQIIQLFAKYFAEQRVSIMTNTPPPPRNPRLIIHATTPVHTKVFVGNQIIGMVQRIQIDAVPYLPYTEVQFPDADGLNEKMRKQRDEYIALVHTVPGVHVVTRKHLERPDVRDEKSK